MSDYLIIAEQARKAFTSVARLEAALRDRPNDSAIRINLAAMQKFARQAERRLEEIAAIEHVEICSYRLVPASHRSYALKDVSQSLLNFQNLFSQIYDALKNGCKAKTTLGADAARESTLELAYTYSGSLGVKLLAASVRDFWQGKLDTSIDALFQILDIEDEDTVRDVVQHLGVSVIKRVHDWSKANVDGDFSTDITWLRSDGKTLGQMVDRSRLEKIVHYIEHVSDEKTTEIEIEGILVALSLPQKSYQIVDPDGERYSGHFSEKFNRPKEFTIGGRYKAVIESSRIVFYATEREKVTNYLARLIGPL